ncbi:GNAT family N-acetyltransferase [bacterium]|nr:GNAT family N-acetyltransferase [bacterium]
MDGWTIIEADEQHLDTVVELWTELMQYHSERDVRFTSRKGAHVLFRDYAKQYIEREDGKLWLAFVDDQPAAYVTARFSTTPPVFVGQETVILEDMVVREPFRRMGLGRELTQRVIDWAQAESRDNVQLQVAEVNPEGQKFWREMGFRDITRVMRYELGVHKRWDEK